MRAVFGDPANLVEREEEAQAGDEPASALDYLQDVYRGRRAAEHSRMRAAMAALPFESPKLAVTAINNMSGEDFARLLDRAIARSRNPPPMIEHRPSETVPGVQWTGPIGGRDE